MELTLPMEVTESGIVTWVRLLARSKADCSPGERGGGCMCGLGCPVLSARHGAGRCKNKHASAAGRAGGGGKGRAGEEAGYMLL